MKIIFRCDATADTGLGHLSRSLAVAEGIRRAGGECLFVGHWSGAAFTLLRESNFPHRAAAAPTGTLADAGAFVGIIAVERATGVLVDSYLIDVEWIEHLAECRAKVVLMDDFARLADYSGCAGVINFTVGAPVLNYAGLGSERLALGLGYFPARRRLMPMKAR